MRERNFSTNSRSQPSKLWELHGKIPQCSELDELMENLNMKVQVQQEDIKISAGELQAIVKESTGRAGGPDRGLPDDCNMLPKEFLNDWQTFGDYV